MRAFFGNGADNSELMQQVSAMLYRNGPDKSGLNPSALLKNDPLASWLKPLESPSAALPQSLIQTRQKVDIYKPVGFDSKILGSENVAAIVAQVAHALNQAVEAVLAVANPQPEMVPVPVPVQVRRNGYSPTPR